MIGWLEKTPLYPKVYFEDVDRMRAIGGIGSVCSLRHLPISPERFFGGICFSECSDPIWSAFSPAFFFLPKIEVEECAEKVIAVKKHQFSLDSHLPSSAEWKKSVESALEKIAWKRLNKIVLARRTRLQSKGKINPYALVRALREHNPHTLVFLFALSPDLYFLGATPERLYQREGKRLMTLSLAGTRKRGDSDEEDARLEQELLSSVKEQNEFGFVRSYLKSRMEELCEEVRSEKRKVLKLHYVQHLYQEFQGNVKAAISDGEIIQALHPTPALGGFPREAAEKERKELECFDRGWYGAPIGFVSKQKADFAVGIRSLLIHENAAYAFAGTGIVAGSDPMQEWEELGHKMRNYL